MTLLIITLDAVKELTTEINATSEAINRGMIILGWMLVVIMGLIATIWKSNDKRNSKTEDKVEKLTEQVTILVTLMAKALPDIKENTEEIKDMQINCATNGHSKKKAS
jgi:hypothetical protein